MSFKEIPINEVDISQFTIFTREWTLLSAGTEETGFNMMTMRAVSYGRFWGKQAMTICVRESRYTRKFTDDNEIFTLSYYGEANHKALEICGKLHGNECDKVKESGLTPMFLYKTVAFEEANIIFICKKLYHADVVRENIDDQQAFDHYYTRETSMHRIYYGEIVKVLAKE